MRKLQIQVLKLQMDVDHEKDKMATYLEKVAPYLVKIKLNEKFTFERQGHEFNIKLHVHAHLMQEWSMVGQFNNKQGDVLALAYVFWMGFVISGVIVYIVFVDLRKALHYLMLCYMLCILVFVCFGSASFLRKRIAQGKATGSSLVHIYLSVWLFVHLKCSSVGLLHDLGGSNTKKKWCRQCMIKGASSYKKLCAFVILHAAVVTKMQCMLAITMKHLTIKHDLKVCGAQVREMNWMICADLGKKRVCGEWWENLKYNMICAYRIVHACSCHHISTSTWKEFRTHFFFNNLFDTHFWETGRKHVVHIFVYQRDVQAIIYNIYWLMEGIWAVVIYKNLVNKMKYLP